MSGIEMIDKCDLCGAKSDRFETLVRELPGEGSVLSKLGVSQAYTTVLCRNCGWVFKPGILSLSQLEDLYGEFGGNATVTSENQRLTDIRSEEQYEIIKGMVDDFHHIKKVLDVGGGIGQATKTFAEKGTDVTVLDMVGGDLVHDNMSLIKSSIDDYSVSEVYDLVVMNHVAEHVWDPSRMFIKANTMLRADGYLYVEVPFELITPVIKRKLGDTCHVGYFSKNSLRVFLKRSGFEVLDIGPALGRYNARRVMILRAIAKKLSSEDAARLGCEFNEADFPGSFSRYGLLKEIFNTKQMMVMIGFLVSRSCQSFRRA